MYIRWIGHNDMKNLSYLIKNYAKRLPKDKDGRTYLTVITSPDDCGGNDLDLAIGARFRFGQRNLPKRHHILLEIPVEELPEHLGDEFPKTFFGKLGIWDMRWLCLIVLEKVNSPWRGCSVPFLEGFFRSYEEVFGE